MVFIFLIKYILSSKLRFSANGFMITLGRQNVANSLRMVLPKWLLILLPILKIISYRPYFFGDDFCYKFSMDLFFFLGQKKKWEGGGKNIKSRLWILRGSIIHYIWVISLYTNYFTVFSLFGKFKVVSTIYGAIFHFQSLHNYQKNK